MKSSKPATHTENHAGGRARRLLPPLRALVTRPKVPSASGRGARTLRLTSPFLLLVLGIAALALFAGSPAEPAAAQVPDRLTLTLHGVEDSPVVCYQASGSWTAPDNVWLTPMVTLDGDAAVPAYQAGQWEWTQLFDIHLGESEDVDNVTSRPLSDVITYHHKGTIFTHSDGEFAEFEKIGFSAVGLQVGLEGPENARHPAVSPGETISWSGNGTLELKEDFDDTFKPEVIGETFDPYGIYFRLNVEGGEPNRRPYANPGGHRNIFEGRIQSLDGTGSSDPEGCPLTYEWHIPQDFGLAEGSSVNSANRVNTARAKLIFPYVTEPKKRYTVGLRVTDPHGLSGDYLVSVWVFNKGEDPNRLHLADVTQETANFWLFGSPRPNPYYYQLSGAEEPCRQTSIINRTLTGLQPGREYTLKAYSQAGCRHLIATVTFETDEGGTSGAGGASGEGGEPASAYIVNCKPAGADSSNAGCTNALTEENLNGAKLRVQLEGDTYAASLDAGNFTLATNVPGLSVESVKRKANRRAELALAYTGADFDEDRTIAVAVSVDALEGDAALTTGEATVEAVVE